MREMGSYEAKTHFSQLLDAVAKGEKVTITKHGVPVAMMVPIDGVTEDERLQAIEFLRNFNKGHTITSKEVRGMIEEGRL